MAKRKPGGGHGNKMTIQRFDSLVYGCIASWLLRHRVRWSCASDRYTYYYSCIVTRFRATMVLHTISANRSTFGPMVPSSGW